MTAVRFVAAIALAALATAPAAADWENTRWGATVDQTVTAVGGNTVKVKGRDGERVLDQDLRAKSTTDFDGVKVDRLFFFDPSGGLSVVKLQPAGQDCDAFVAAVRKKLGPAKTAESKPLLNVIATHRATWADKDANLAILMFDVRVDGDTPMRVCHLLYQPYGDGTPGIRDRNGKTLPQTDVPSSEPGI